MSDISIGTLIHNRRIELHLTMKQLADKVGVAEGTISRWESGKIKDMRRDKIKMLAIALDISLYVLMDWTDSSIKEPGSVVLTKSETAIIKQYNDLNDKGKEYINDQFVFALSQDKYKAQPATEEPPLPEEKSASFA
ncbi:MAG: helix-turn-helix transcriptional regulator [Acidaminococcaceae bacterium]|nr:helix-turn-helix transcriptional regulator [Acidaminococcaceae bacterium]